MFGTRLLSLLLMNLNPKLVTGPSLTLSKIYRKIVNIPNNINTRIVFKCDKHIENILAYYLDEWRRGCVGTKFINET